MAEATTHDGSLMERLRNEPTDALGELFETERPQLKQFIANRLNPLMAQRVDDSDIIQQTYLAASENLESYLSRPPIPPDLWVRSLARREVFLTQRFHLETAKRNARMEVSPVEHSSLATDDSPPEQHVYHDETVAKLRDVINRMKDEDRAVLNLCFLQELTITEAASRLSVDYQTLRKRLVRALRRLQTAAAESGVDL